MALVKGPNGLVYDWPEPLVESLVRSAGHERVERPKSEPKAKESATPKRRTSTAKK